VIPGIGGHPRNVMFLAADAFGVLPPIARLTPEQAMYHFLSGYTAKLAGTEAGMGSDPVPGILSVFCAPFFAAGATCLRGDAWRPPEGTQGNMLVVNTGGLEQIRRGQAHEPETYAHLVDTASMACWTMLNL